eukprot:symbB.v1.2.006205.t1/scaffold355.1/size243294/15
MSGAAPAGIATGSGTSTCRSCTCNDKIGRRQTGLKTLDGNKVGRPGCGEGFIVFFTGFAHIIQRCVQGICVKRRSEKIESESTAKWTCDCGAINLMSRSHCTKCGKLRKEDREQRMVARANLGLGRGGGYFERDDAARHRGRDADDAKGGLDMYGRWRPHNGAKDGQSPARKPHEKGHGSRSKSQRSRSSTSSEHRSNSKRKARSRSKEKSTSRRRTSQSRVRRGDTSTSRRERTRERSPRGNRSRSQRRDRSARRERSRSGRGDKRSRSSKMNREKRAEARGEMKENGKEKLQNNRNKASEQRSEKAAEKEEPEAPEPGSKAERQAAALARLRGRKRLSPPKPSDLSGPLQGKVLTLTEFGAAEGVGALALRCHAGKDHQQRDCREQPTKRQDEQAHGGSFPEGG